MMNKVEIMVKRSLKRLIQTAGYDVHRMKALPGFSSDIKHAYIRPVATYSPWLSDRDFSRVYDAIKTNTLVDIFRCFELWQLVGDSGKLEHGDFIEIGVWRGGTGCLMAKKCQSAGILSKVYLCDTFTGVVKAGPLDTGYFGGEHADTSKDLVENLVRSLALDNVEILQGIFPDDTGSVIQDRKFRLCHIDVDVYQSAKDILDWIWGRMVPGSIIVFDDYGFLNCDGITHLVNEQRAHSDRSVIYNLNGHGLIMKLK